MRSRRGLGRLPPPLVSLRRHGEGGGTSWSHRTLTPARSAGTIVRRSQGTVGGGVVRMLTFACTGCGQELRALSMRAGREVRCPRCGGVGIVPSESSAPEGPAVPPPAPAPVTAAPVEPPPARRRRGNPFSATSVLLAFFCSPAALATVFLCRSVASGVRVGLALAALGAVSGAAGVALAVCTGRRGAVSGGIGLFLDLVGVAVYLHGLNVLGAIASNEGVPDFVRRTVDPARGGGRTVTLVCAVCGKEAEVPAWEVFEHHLRGLDAAFKALRDPEGFRADVRAAAARGLRCPACGEAALFGAIECADCGRRFVSPWRGGDAPLDLEVRCPHCGAVQEHIGPYGIDRRALERLVEDLTRPTQRSPGASPAPEPALP